MKRCLIKNSLIALSILLMLTLVACENNNISRNKLKEYKAHFENIHNVLHFTGTIQPMEEQTLTTPMDAVIERMNYRYGQKIKKEDVIFVLYSPELQKQYNDILTEYLKAKDNYMVAQGKFTGTNDLWEAGLISKNNYLSEKSSLNASRITLMQTGQKLSEMLAKMGSKDYQDLSKLSFEEFDKVRMALKGQHDLIYVRSPVNGVLLYPPQNDEKKHIRVGSSVKAGDAIAVVGNLSGLHIEIDVPEVDVEKIKPGINALVKGVAFAKEILKGKLVSINAQATANQNSLPSFTAMVEVNKLTPKEQALIKVGMSATVELSVESKNKLLIPISAVKHKHGHSFVQIKDPKGRILEKEVVTGHAEVDRVVIDSGLSENDLVVYE